MIFSWMKRATKFLTRGGDSATEQKALDWSRIQYLQDEAVTLELPASGLRKQQVRRVKIYGSPLTPEFGLWASQYPSIRDVWTGRVPDNTNILVGHAPPALYDGVQMRWEGYELFRALKQTLWEQDNHE